MTFRSVAVRTVLVAVIALLVSSASGQRADPNTFSATLNDFALRMDDLAASMDATEVSGPFCTVAERNAAQKEINALWRQKQKLIADYNAWRSSVMSGLSYEQNIAGYEKAGVHPDESSTWTTADHAVEELNAAYQRLINRLGPVVECPDTKPIVDGPRTPPPPPPPPPVQIPPPPPMPEYPTLPVPPRTFCSANEKYEFLKSLYAFEDKANAQLTAWRGYDLQLATLAAQFSTDSANYPAIRKALDAADKVVDAAQDYADHVEQLLNTVRATRIIDCEPPVPGSNMPPPNNPPPPPPPPPGPHAGIPTPTHRTTSCDKCRPLADKLNAASDRLAADAENPRVSQAQIDADQAAVRDAASELDACENRCKESSFHIDIGVGVGLGGDEHHHHDDKPSHDDHGNGDDHHD